MSYTSKVSCKEPWKQRWKHADEELFASAARFKHRSEWKRFANSRYQAARNRGLLDRCCAHMEPMASPYGKNYEIYVYEFADHYAYIGLTFLPRARSIQHQIRGPVAEHSKVCGEVTRRILESALTRAEAPITEIRWIEKYRAEGWTLLNKNNGGCTGTVRGRKWTREAVLAEARKYPTKQTWIDGSQMSYRVAKREGWFAEASAHMPKRGARHLVGRKITKTSKEKMRVAKLGTKQSKSHRLARSKALKLWWQNRRTAPKDHPIQTSNQDSQS